MGFLTDGDTLDWSEVQKYCDYIRKHGVKQFLAIYEKTKNRAHDCLKFGDEIEYMLVCVDENKKKVKLCLRANEILTILMQEELEGKTYTTPLLNQPFLPFLFSSLLPESPTPIPPPPQRHVPTLWRPEYARYMVEGPASQPPHERVEACLLTRSAVLV